MTNERRRENQPDRDIGRITRDMDMIAAELHVGALRSFLRRLCHGSSRWIRIPVALLLIAGGLFGFLPVLGLWMLPLGALLLALDIAVLRKPMLWLVGAVKRLLIKLRQPRIHPG